VSAQTSLLRAKIDYILAEYSLSRAMGYDLAHLIKEENTRMKQSSQRKNSVDAFLGVGNR
jgi:hypothetical protein